MKIHTRLLATTLIISIVPLTLIGSLGLWRSYQALTEHTFSHLQSVRESKKHQIERFFEDRREDMLVLLRMVSLLRQDAEQKLLSVQSNKIAQLEALLQERLRNILVLSHDEWIAQALEQFDGAMQAEGKVGGLAWQSIEGRLGRALQEIQQEYDYFDLLLISKEANVVYSTRQGADLGTSLSQAVPSLNPLRDAFDKGLQQLAIIDFSPYADADGQQVAFISAPLHRFGELSGVLVLAFTVDSHAPNSMNTIMQRREGLGYSGESLLLSRHEPDSPYQVIGDVAAPDAEAYANGLHIASDLPAHSSSLYMTKNKLLKLSTYSALNIDGLNWALVTQINLEEAITPKLHKEQADFFSQYITHYGYRDLLLVHPQGQIFYSVAKEDDYGSNLFEDEYSDTHLAELVRQVRDSGQLAFSDYALYEPSNNEPAAFIAQPLLSSQGVLELIVVLQQQSNSMGDIMGDRAGMGTQGESYLVGADYLLRSNSFLDLEHRSVQASLHNPAQGSIKTASVEAALAGKSGELIGTNYLGQRVLSAYAPLDIADRHWALVVDINAREAFAGIHQFMRLSIGLMLFIIGLCWWFASGFTHRLVQPLLQVRDHLTLLSQGEVPSASLNYAGHDEIADIFAASKQLKQALRTIIAQANNIAAGNYNHQINLLSDKDELGQALVNMHNTLSGVIQQAHFIAQGDYSREVRVLSDNDQLGQALANMTRTLRQMHTENATALAKLEQENAQKSRADWFKTGISQLNERMSGQQNTATLSKHIIHFLANYVEAQIGTFYLLQQQPSNEQGILKLFGSYAYTRRKNISHEFVLGESLVGQAALEKQLIVVSAVPDDYTQIQSSLGAHAPHNLVIVPFMYEGKLAGVFELGRFAAFSDDELSFLEQVTQPIGIAINTAESRLRLQELLEQSRAQTEELQSQSEELQTQQEELRQSNDELAARGRDLEAQREAIHKQNNALEESQKAIQAKAEELELASKYKSEFLANMSHELRTPLNSMLILSQMLMENRPQNLTQQQVESARTIHQAGNDLLRLINDILDLSKVEAGKMKLHMEVFALEPVIENLRRKCQPLADDKNLHLSFHSDLAPDTCCHSDSQRLEQILTNLLSNALKFTEAGGQVSLKISQTADDLLAFAVTDTGIGISPAQQKVIFEAFQQADGTTSRRFGGTGLGLSISRQLAKLLGGQITLHSVSGEGSTFTLSIPLEAASLPMSPTAAGDLGAANLQISPAAVGVSADLEVSRSQSSHSQISPAAVGDLGVANLQISPAAAGGDSADLEVSRSQSSHSQADPAADGDKSLLIIEDDNKFCQILADLARQRGFKALCANDGKQGLHMAREHRPSAIILDAGLPQLDGWTVMEALKDDAQTRHIPVHFISGADKPADARHMGAIGYLLKPVSMTELSGAFQTIESFIQNPLKQVLVLADDAAHSEKIVQLLQTDVVKVTHALSKAAATDLLMQAEANYDCVVLDVSSEQETGLSLLEELCQQEKTRLIPVIIYAERALSAAEEKQLESCTQQLTLKSVRSPEHLLDEAVLFLHQIESQLPEPQREVLHRLHDKDALFQGKKVLLADDDMRNVFALGSVLEDKGMELVLAKNGEEAVQQLREHPDISLILMDLMMPKMDGFEAMRQIRSESRFKKVPIIALTAKAMKNDRSKSIEAGANDYLSKPIEMDKLLSLIRVWLHGV